MDVAFQSSLCSVCLFRTCPRLDFRLSLVSEAFSPNFSPESPRRGGGCVFPSTNSPWAPRDLLSRTFRLTKRVPAKRDCPPPQHGFVLSALTLKGSTSLVKSESIGFRWFLSSSSPTLPSSTIPFLLWPIRKVPLLSTHLSWEKAVFGHLVSRIFPFW